MTPALLGPITHVAARGRARRALAPICAGALLALTACGTTPAPAPAGTVLYAQDVGDTGSTLLDTGSDTAVVDTATQDTPSVTDVAAPPKDSAATADTPIAKPDIAEQIDTAVPPKDAGNTKPPPICKKPSDCYPHKNTPICKVLDAICVQCVTDFHCKESGGVCTKDNVCAQASCLPGTKACIDGFQAVCAADGKGWDKSACPDNAPFCIDGKCAKCIPDSNYCAAPQPGQTTSKLLMKCNSSGSDGDIVMQCGGATVCLNGKCGICTAGVKKCDGFKAMVCKADGSGWEVTSNCAEKDLACLGGLCVDPCGADIKSNTNVGCDYWAVDLDNAQVPCGPKLCDAQNMQYSVIISNTKTSKAEITITTGAGKSAKYTVPGQDMLVINLPDPAWGGAPLNQQGSSINNLSFRIQSTVPIVAYQFNPLANFDVFSNDASLLLPANVIGSEYFVMSRQQNHNDLRGFATIVGTSKGKTTVEIVVSAKTLPGAGIPPLKKGQSFKFTLQQGEVFNLETNELGADLTGSWIKSDQPVAVFGGHEGGNVPDTNRCIKPPGQLEGKCEYQGWACKDNSDCPITCCADHLEEQLFPVSAWGTTYLASKLMPRGLEKDVYRILAAHDGTLVTTDPPQTAVPPLSKGQWFEFESDKDFLIKSTKPISVGQFMTSANAPNPNNDTCTEKFSGTKVCAHHLKQLPDANKCVANKCQELAFLSCVKDSDCPVKEPIACSKSADCPNIKEASDAATGDPAFMLVVPVDRFLKEYVVLVPDKYAKNFINISAPKAAVVMMDGVAVPEVNYKPVGQLAEWKTARIEVKPGKRKIDSTVEIGLMVYGHDKFVSYGYPGGARVK